MRRGLAFALLAAASVSAHAQPGRDAELHAFLQERFAEDRADAPDTRYVWALADLNGDGRPEALVSLISRTRCGTGGCDLYIYTPEQGSRYQHGALNVTNPPIVVLNSGTHGWRDLAVRVAGGGARPRMARLRHGELTYESNPSLAPSAPISPAGRIVIAEGDEGRPLF